VLARIDGDDDAPTRAADERAVTLHLDAAGRLRLLRDDLRHPRHDRLERLHFLVRRRRAIFLG